MASKEFVGKTIKPDENTTLAKLSLVEMLRLLFSKMSNDDTAELDASEKLSADYLKKKASLTKFLNKATDKLIKGTESSVTVAISSVYLPYINEVIDPIKGMGRFFNFDVRTRDVPDSVKYRFIVIISKK